jgi:hypothetical protein
MRHSTNAVELMGQLPLPVYLSASHLQQTSRLSQRSRYDMKRTQVASESEALPEKRQRYEALPAADYQDHDDTSETHDEAVHEEPSTLCSRCSSIDVESLFIELNNGRYAYKKLMSLGKLGVEAELSSCSLCRLFHAVRIQDDDRPPVDDYALYLTLAPWPNPELVLAVAPEGHSYSGNLADKGVPREFIAYSEESDIGIHVRSLRGRSIDARAIDFNILRGWVELCVQKHEQRCVQVESSASSLRDIKLIDCELRQIVPGLPSSRYSALSYVWGTSKSGNEDECVDNILPTTLPRTIEDAVSVTKALGLRYIWIDRYCIDQGNDAEKQIQIHQMDLIYQHAFVTIVAAAGTDPHFGLPGVGATSRPPQPTAWIKGRCLVSTLSDPTLLTKGSKWMQRAWTYQESFFSTRRIVFTEQQVHYECQRGMARETVDAFYDRFIPFSGWLHGPSNLHSPHPSNILDHLAEYCGRELSVDSDAIRAFEGVFHNYRRGYQVHQYLGIPIMPLQAESSQENRHRSRGEAFAAALTWCNQAPGTRRSLFPTWSWAGWTVPINYEGEPCKRGLDLKNERPLKIFIESCDGSLLDMDELSDALLDQGIPGSSGKFIHIEAWTIPIDVRYLPNGAEELQYHGHLYDGGSEYLSRFQSDEGAVEFPMYPLYQKHENDVTTQQSRAPNFKSGSLLGIVLGRCDFSHLYWPDVIFIMVVQEKERYYERVGHILLSEHTGERIDGYLENPESAVISGFQSIWRSKERRTIRLG